MSTSIDKLAKELKTLMTASDDRKPRPYDAQAEVLRVDRNVAWVHIPGGVSDCVDLLLWSPQKGAYYDPCCYVRFQVEGKMHAGCVGLSEENYLDTYKYD